MSFLLHAAESNMTDEVLKKENNIELFLLEYLALDLPLSNIAVMVDTVLSDGNTIVKQSPFSYVAYILKRKSDNK